MSGCCLAGPSRKWCIFFPPVPIKWFYEMELSEADVGDLLRADQAGIYFLLAIHFCIQILWQLLAYIPGMCPIVGATSFNALCHLGFWSAIDFAALAMGCMSLGFSVYVYPSGNFEKDISLTRKWLLAWIFVLVLAIVANTVHLIAISFETYHCTTTLCTSLTNQSYLTALTVGIVMLLAFEGLLLYLGATYRHRLYQVNQYMPAAFVLNKKPATVVLSKRSPDEPFYQPSSFIPPTKADNLTEAAPAASQIRAQIPHGIRQKARNQ